MTSKEGLCTRSRIKPITLNRNIKTKPITRSIKTVPIDDLDFDLVTKFVSPVDAISKQMKEYCDKSRKKFELFVLSELYNRGYDLLRLKKSNCWSNTQPISENCERTQFYVDGVLALATKQTIRFEDINRRYIVYIDYEVES